MTKILSMLALVLTCALFVSAQGETRAIIIVKDADSGAALAGAVVTDLASGTSLSADEAGAVTFELSASGPRRFRAEYPGYEAATVTIELTAGQTATREVGLEPGAELAEVTVNITRTGREISAEPTRVEAIDEEEIDEKINMRPANVAMVLNESTGIKVQQTSATSATQSIRIQGLDGRYTQLLKDGFPAYGGFSGSLSVLEIPPLDLAQVEIIKGPAATFYGEGAIAGVINFISKRPEEKMSTTLLFNQTSALGTDVSVFNTARNEGLGYTLLGSFNYQNEYDVEDDGFSDLPRTHSFNLSPRLFVYRGEGTTFTVGNSFSYQRRIGGDMFAIANGPSGDAIYTERNRSVRNITTAALDHSFSTGSRLLVRQSVSFFDRELVTPFRNFRGRQLNSYTDVSFLTTVGRHGLVLGASVKADDFDERTGVGEELDRSESTLIFGGYIQDTVDITPKLSLEAGLRVDHARDLGTFVLPRASALYRLTENITSRVGFGLGYKTPTVFTEESERILFRNVLPIGPELKAERSFGGTFDINYDRDLENGISFALNQMFFYTRITDPIILTLTGEENFLFVNAAENVTTRGLETNLRAGYGLGKLFIGYTFTDARAGYRQPDQVLPLTPRHKINSALVLEEHENFKAGLEAHYTGRQALDNGERTPDYFVVGVFGEKTFGRFSLFLNAENITDVRQSRFSRVVTGPRNDPRFADVFTHLEGRVFNGGVKIRF